MAGTGKYLGNKSIFFIFSGRVESNLPPDGGKPQRAKLTSSSGGLCFPGEGILDTVLAVAVAMLEELLRPTGSPFLADVAVTKPA